MSCRPGCRSNRPRNLYSRYETLVCHWCKSEKELCQKVTSLAYKGLTNPLSFLPSGELKNEVQKKIEQLGLIHDIQPNMKEVTEEFRRVFKEWSKYRLEVIEELTKFIGEVIVANTGKKVVKVCGKVTSIIGGCLAIGALLLAPETGGISLSVWGIRVTLASRMIQIGAEVVDGAFTHIQSKRVANLLEKDRKMTEKMETAVESLMTTSKLFNDAVEEFEKRHQWFGMDELAEGVNNLKLEYSEAKSALDVVGTALKAKPFEMPSKTVRGVTGFLIGIYVIMDAVDLMKTIKDIQNGSKSDLQEHITALSAVLIREHEILQKQYESFS
ncbi:uncharacterized protein [Antedon mediterranea]|uniref:uncharacterized protein n=1 Tax=Antedon mediterranea TaxID=105859 RepID=UPI003AF9AF31